MNYDKELAGYIDHTLLKPDATSKDIEKLCKEAIDYQFKTVCVNPTWVGFASSILEGTSVLPITVVGFPLGATDTDVKKYEASLSINKGAKEIDMVMNIGALKEKNYKLVHEDIWGVVKECGEIPVKVIIETCYLTEKEIETACIIAKSAGASFVKTSTGFGPYGAKIEHVKLMRETVGEDMGVKASGGIRDRETAWNMIKAGANRIGSSSSVKIVRGE